MEDFSKYNAEGTVLRQMQLRILDILVEIDKVCRTHGIKYWIDYGTLLGAVRHGGFIPWDDDLDITMMRDDYTKFLSIAPSQMPNWLFLQTTDTDPSYRSLLCKIRDKNSFFVTQHEDFTREYNKGLYVDVFVAEKYPDVPDKLLKINMKWLKKTAFFYTVKQDINLKNIVAALTFPIIRFFWVIIWKILNVKPKSKIGYVPDINYYGVSYSPEILFPLSEIKFEGKMFFAPCNPDKYLRIIYHDYKQIPPSDKRITHIIYVDIK